jgi:hypothetical protein
MALREIPITAGTLAFRFKIDLDNRPFNMQFTFNRRLLLWTMNISDDAGTDLIVGIPIHVKQNLLLQFKYNQQLPQGELFALNLVDDVSPPNQDNFGSDVVLLYNDLETA